MDIQTNMDRMLMNDLNFAMGIIRMDIARAIGYMEGRNVSECDLGSYRDCYKGYGIERDGEMVKLYVESTEEAEKPTRFTLVMVNEVFDFHALVEYLSDGLASFKIQMIE